LIELAPLTAGPIFRHESREFDPGLEKSLGLVKYQVLRIRDGKIVTPDPLDLNTTCEDLDKPGDRRSAIACSFADRERPAQADVAVEGGEALELFVKRGSELGRTATGAIAVTTRRSAIRRIKCPRPAIRKSARSFWARICPSGPAAGRSSSSRCRTPLPSSSVPGRRKFGWKSSR